MPDDRHAARLPVAPLTGLFAVAGVLGVVSVALPHDPETHEAAVLGLAALALGLAAVVHAAASGLNANGLTALLALGSGLTSGAILATGGVPNASAALYSWVALYGFYALPRHRAFALVGLVAVQYAAVIALDPPGFPAAAHWTTTIGTLLGAGVLVGTLKDRLDAAFARLASAAQTDPLTGLGNRRALREAADLELARCVRTGRPLALVLLDVDRFKAVNDRLGHLGGDAVLRDVARVLREQARATDVVARTGGEELAILLPETGPAEAVVLAERVRRAITAGASREGGPLTASFGVAAWPAHGTTVDGLMHSADRALYAAKRTGRDRVVRFDPETTAELLAGGDGPGRQEALVLLAESLDLRDARTGAHSQTVGRLAALAAAELGLAPAEVEKVRLAGVLHDIGKLSLPDSVLLKPGPLTEEETAVVRRHPELGARMLEGAGLDDLAAWVRCHHERPDGTGYPRGLRAPAIPFESRVLAVADAYEAMTADRPYRPGRPHAEAVAELRAHAGTQFDPAVVHAFLRAVVPAA